MSTPPSVPVAHTPRARFFAVWLLTAGALTIACILGAVLAARFHARWDVTSARDNSLTARIRAIIDRLDEPVRITIVAPISEMDRAARTDLLDLADALAASSGDRVTVELADSRDAATAQVISDLVARIAERDRPTIDLHRATITAQADVLATTVTTIERLHSPIERLADALGDPGPGSRWRGALASLAPLSSELLTASRELPAFADSPMAGSALPEPDAAAQALAALLQRIADGMAALKSESQSLIDTSSDGPVRDAARQVLQLADMTAESAGIVTSVLAPLTISDAVRVARTLERAEAIVVEGPCAVIIRPLDALYAAGGFDGEVPLASAIAAASSPLRPVLVLVHAERESILDPTGAPSPALAAVCGRTLQDVASRGWRLAEWPVLNEPMMPDRARFDAATDDPIVWFVLGSPGTASAEAIERTTKLAGAIEKLLERGEPALITVLPSDLPALGEIDPIASAIGGIGHRPETSRPLVTRTTTPLGPSFSVDQNPIASRGHPIAEAVGTLPMVLRLATPIRTVYGINGQDAPLVELDLPPGALLSLEHSPDRWGEANWRILGTSRALAEPPTPDPERDSVLGPWMVAYASERPPLPNETTPRRAVIIDAALWYADAFTQSTVQVEGRTALRFPGNLQFLHASLAWLAGQDDLIPPAPDVRDVPRIPALAATHLSTLRWLLAAGMPALALLAAAAVRIARRRSRL